MGVYHDVMDRNDDREFDSVRAGVVDTSFFIFADISEYEDYDSIVAYWLDEVNKVLMA